MGFGGLPRRMSGGSGSGFRGKLEHVLYSGDKKHVMAGIAIIGVVFCSPWFLMNRVMLKLVLFGLCSLATAGSKHQSHQDYMEKADKARQARLSAK